MWSAENFTKCAKCSHHQSCLDSVRMCQWELMPFFSAASHAVSHPRHTDMILPMTD